METSKLKLNILVLDGNRDSLMLFRKKFGGLFEITESNNKLKALEALKQGKFDAIAANLDFVGSDCLSWLSGIRETTDNLPVLFYSSCTNGGSSPNLVIQPLDSAFGEFPDARIFLQSAGDRGEKGKPCGETPEFHYEELIRIERDLGIALSSATGLNETMTRFLDISFQLEGIDCGGVYIADPVDGGLDLIVHRGFSFQYLGFYSYVDIGSELGSDLQQGRSVFGSFDQIGAEELNKQDGIRSTAFIPVMNEDKLVSALHFASHKIEEFSPNMMKTLESIASRLGGAFARIKAEEARRESEERYRLLVETMNEGLGAQNEDGLITYVNGSLCRMLGYTRDEMLNRQVSDFFDESEPPVLNEQILVRNDIQYAQYEAVWKARDGRKIYTIISSTPFMGDDGHFKGSLAVITDITQRKKNEEELRRYREHLEELVRDRTSQLEQELLERKRIEAELIKARDRAEAANRAKSEFLANMSHEIRTPMNGVLGTLDLALDSDLTAAQEEYLTMAKSSAHSLLNLLNDILDFSKIEAGKLRIVNSNFELKTVIDTAIASIKLLAHKKGLRLKYRIDQGIPPYLMGDSGRLRQVMVNILGNAVKFTESGGIFIRADRRHIGEISPGNDSFELHFSIKDTGIGIEKSKQESIFESFTQVDGSHTRHYEGTGLGLAISKRLLEIMGGRIWVESMPGRGSTFHFVVPFKEGREEIRDRSLSEIFGIMPSGAKTDGGKMGDGVRILLAEDNEVNRRVFLETLHREGYQVTPVNNGREAVEAVRSQSFDMILMDVQMPEMDGLEATRIIKRINKEIPIIALTAHALTGDREICLDAGMDNYITKPLDRNKLLEMTQKYCHTLRADLDMDKLTPAINKMKGRTFDQSKISPEFHDDRELLVRTALDFIEKSYKNFQKMKKNMENYDEGSMEQLLNDMRQQARKLGADRISDEVFRLKIAARKGDPRKVSSQISILEDELEKFKIELFGN